MDVAYVHENETIDQFKNEGFGLDQAGRHLKYKILVHGDPAGGPPEIMSVLYNEIGS